MAAGGSDLAISTGIELRIPWREQGWGLGSGLFMEHQKQGREFPLCWGGSGTPALLPCCFSRDAGMQELQELQGCRDSGDAGGAEDAEDAGMKGCRGCRGCRGCKGCRICRDAGM